MGFVQVRGVKWLTMWTVHVAMRLNCSNKSRISFVCESLFKILLKI